MSRPVLAALRLIGSATSGWTDLATTVRQLLDRGSQLLGRPLLRGEDGEAFAILRDPCEAVVAVRETSRRARREPVTWHRLHTRDLERSWARSALAG